VDGANFINNVYVQIHAVMAISQEQGEIFEEFIRINPFV
jgi:hypothetical protein